MRRWIGVGALLIATPCLAQTPEKELVLSISGPQLKGGVVSEIAWDGRTVVVQTAFRRPDGTLAAQFFVRPADGTSVAAWPEHSAASLQYWQTKSRRLSPTGLGAISVANDAALPIYGVGSLQQRIDDAASMGGTVSRHVIKLNSLMLHERFSVLAPYDGETWSWSPPELNRVAYVDGRGDLWVAIADGRSATRIARGQFTLPAWSDDGGVIAIAEKKGSRWDVSVIHVPAELRRIRPLMFPPTGT